MRRIIAAVFCATLFATAISSDADARPRRHHHHHTSRHHHNRHHYRYREMEYRTAFPAPQYQQPNFFQTQPSQFSGFSGFVSTGSNLVAKARRYLGDTAREVGVRSTLWCSAFVRKLTHASGVDDRAKSWLSKPRVGPRVGAIAVMGRKGGGHVGIVSGFTRKGDPIVISGNHGNRVRESVYPAGRIIAYVSAS